MNTTKNKLLTWLVILLLIANVASIALFWIGKNKPPRPAQNGSPAAFLTKELQLDSMQQQLFEVLRKEHHDSAEKIRAQIKDAKEAFFSLLKQATVVDSTKENLSKSISVLSEKLDLLTFNHFQKLRTICKPEQQEKFDDLILQVTHMISQQRPRGPAGDRPPPRDHNGKRPPPPEGREADGPPPEGPPPGSDGPPPDGPPPRN